MRRPVHSHSHPRHHAAVRLRKRVGYLLRHDLSIRRSASGAHHCDQRLPRLWHPSAIIQSKRSILDFRQPERIILRLHRQQGDLLFQKPLVLTVQIPQILLCFNIFRRLRPQNAAFLIGLPVRLVDRLAAAKPLQQPSLRRITNPTQAGQPILIPHSPFPHSDLSIQR